MEALFSEDAGNVAHRNVAEGVSNAWDKVAVAPRIRTNTMTTAAVEAVEVVVSAGKITINHSGTGTPQSIFDLIGL